MEIAKDLLNVSDEAIPVQIVQDLASAHLELETNFDAVSQMCAEKSHTLMQAMETGRVRATLSMQYSANRNAGIYTRGSNWVGV